MLALERQKIILDYLASNEIATTKCLSELTHASLATLRRDLNTLNRQGLLKKTHGGAQYLPLDSVQRPPDSHTQQVLDFDPFLAYKDAIAQKAIEFIHPNDTVFIGAGMTCNLLCRYLKQSDIENITVVTTNITASMELVSNPKIATLLLGGTVHRGTNHVETLDEYTLQSLKALYFDNAFFTVDGVDLNYGYSIANRAQIPLYHYLIQNSGTVYLLANDGKFNKRAFSYLCDLNKVSNVITNASVSQSYLAYYRANSIKVYTV